MGEIFELMSAKEMYQRTAPNELANFLKAIQKQMEYAASAGSYMIRFPFDMLDPCMEQVKAVLIDHGYKVIPYIDHDNLLCNLHIYWYEAHNAPQRMAGSS